MTGKIYKITSPSGKAYIGQTIQNLNERIRNHRKSKSNCTLLKRAAEKYGWENMHIEVLVELDFYDKELLDFWEQELISVFTTLAPKGYNCDGGGKSGGKRHDLTKQKIRDALLKNSNDSGYSGNITVTGPERYRLRWGNKSIGTYSSKKLAQHAASVFITTGHVIPGTKRGAKAQVIMLRSPTNLQFTLGSGKAAADKIGCSPQLVTMACTGRRRTAKGWACWYAKDEEYIPATELSFSTTNLS